MRLALLMGLLLAPLPAYAGMSIVAISATVGSSAVQVYPGVDSRGTPMQLTIANSNSAGNQLSCGFTSTITLNGAGTFSIAAGQTAFWPTPTAPNAPIWCISSANTAVGGAIGYQ